MGYIYTKRVKRLFLVIFMMIPAILNADTIYKGTLNEVGSPFVDSVGGVNAICADTVCPTQVVGQVGSAQEFDGINDVLHINENNINNFGAQDSFSIELWMKPDSTNLQVALGKGNNGRYVWIATHENKVKFELSGGPMFMSSQTNIELGSWTHVVLSKNSTSNIVFLYINGELDSHHNINTPTDINGNITIGNLAGGYFFDGAIDNVLIYNNALTALEVQERYCI